ncbi:MAG: hypothetical protein R3B52_01935 [Candidatus Paceibacterota bacterium]
MAQKKNRRPRKKDKVKRIIQDARKRYKKVRGKVQRLTSPTRRRKPIGTMGSHQLEPLFSVVAQLLFKLEKSPPSWYI